MRLVLLRHVDVHVFMLSCPEITDHADLICKLLASVRGSHLVLIIVMRMRR